MNKLLVFKSESEEEYMIGTNKQTTQLNVSVKWIRNQCICYESSGKLCTNLNKQQMQRNKLLSNVIELK